MPSFAELAELLNYASKGAVRYVVSRLIEAGYLDQDEKGYLLPSKLFGSYPILGTIQAGFPSPAEEELIDTISFDQYLVKKPNATYLIKVSGDSMIEAGIMPGDIVIVERSNKANEGEIVIAQVDKEWTMKYLLREKGRLVLQPANKKYQPIYPQQELVIGGVVKGVVRKL